ncbi:TPA: hypothetical protein SCM97_002785 [Yersinia enterocolitica]|nr:hypothetical protein [Yersinia enterocolitica]HEG1275411.1 hypothetical protein [Yersinia enterocolitica]
MVDIKLVVVKSDGESDVTSVPEGTSLLGIRISGNNNAGDLFLPIEEYFINDKKHHISRWSSLVTDAQVEAAILRS